jgi:hypothetical protein
MPNQGYGYGYPQYDPAYAAYYSKVNEQYGVQQYPYPNPNSGVPPSAFPVPEMAGPSSTMTDPQKASPARNPHSPKRPRLQRQEGPSYESDREKERDRDLRNRDWDRDRDRGGDRFRGDRRETDRDREYKETPSRKRGKPLSRLNLRFQILTHGHLPEKAGLVVRLFVMAALTF